MNYSSQIGQDRWVCEILNYKNRGTWVDIGCSVPQWLNNTYSLETDLNWSGLSLDISQKDIDEWEGERSTEGLICENALTIDYEKWFSDSNLPEVIDYLSMDLEPPTHTLKALYRIPFDKYRFRCITYETDAYRNLGTQEPSRAYLLSKGYVLSQGGVGYQTEHGGQDDFWVYDAARSGVRNFR